MRQPAIIFDRDGTMASVAFTAPKSGAGDAAWANFNASIRFDAPVPVVVALWHSIRPGVARIMVSGRDGAQAPAMRDWMHKNGIFPDAFFHRPAGDRRVDSVVKAQILVEKIMPRWDVRFAVDDRPQVVDMWRAHGIHVMQVTDPRIVPRIAIASVQMQHNVV